MRSLRFFLGVGKMETDRKDSQGDVDRYDLEILLRRPSLRTNIPRRVSQVCRQDVPTEETTCGVGCLRGQWLQSFANRNSFTLIYGVLGSFYGSYYAYFYGVITTLEKRFKISSQTIGIIAAAGDLSLIIMCYILSHYSPKVHRPKWIGAGVLLIVASTAVFTLPHFLHEPKTILGHEYYFHHKNETDNTTCKELQTCATSPEGRYPIILLTLAQILHGIGGSFYFIVGKSYKDENTEKHQPPALLTLLSVLKVLGPAFGYWLSSVCLKIFEYPGLTARTTDKEPQWTGAWWLGSLVIGFILTVPGLLVSLFPTTLPKTAVRRMEGAREIVRNTENRGGKVETLRRLFINPNFSCIQFSATFNIQGFMAYFIFLPKYVETHYQVSASKANLTAGSVTLISSAVGIVMANSVITRHILSARVLASWSIVVGLLSVGGLASYFYLDCPARDNQIKEMSPKNLNITCDCVNSPFSPVCDENHQGFITPCQAGCKDTLHINMTQAQGYELCNDRAPPFTARKIYVGYCPVDCHSNFLKFIITTCLMTFFYATGCVSHHWFEQKLEESEGKSAVLHSGMTFLGLIASVPAPIILGYLIDESCLLWEGNCKWVRNCWFYDNKELRLRMNLMAIVYAVIGIIFDLGVWFSIRNLE